MFAYQYFVPEIPEEGHTTYGWDIYRDPVKEF